MLQNRSHLPGTNPPLIHPLQGVARNHILQVGNACRDVLGSTHWIPFKVRSDRAVRPRGHQEVDFSTMLRVASLALGLVQVDNLETILFIFSKQLVSQY